MNRFILLSLALAALIAAPAVGDDLASVDTEAPREVIRQTADDVIRVLEKSQLTTPQRRAEIEAIALDRFDFVTTAKLVLKRDWRRLSKEQRREFVDEFRTYLANSYGSRLERYEQQTVEMLGERVEPRGDVTVHTKIVGGEIDGVVVDYRMRYRNERWRIIDVIIENVSLVSNFRSQFAEVLAQGGPEELLRRLRTRNAETRAPVPATAG